ncbi:hypothetical protein ACFWF9_00220 [Streptomyces roseolus]|uniref:hypothetical protein n=1 Tax=Streptomyces roseolus TaxID=67358 RepID=UPI00365ED4CA
MDTVCPVPTAVAGHPFTLTLTGTWEEISSPHPHHNPSDAATHHALTIVRSITSTLTPTDSLFAASRINTVLGQPTDIPHIPVRIAWAHADLTCEPEALSATTRLQRTQHEEEQRQAEQDRHLGQARALQTTLMSDPSLAMAYWFATAPDTIDEKTLPRLEELHERIAAYAPQNRWVLLARILHTFIENLSDEARGHLIETAAGFTDRYGRPDTAEAIRRLNEQPDNSKAAPLAAPPPPL